MKPQYVDQIPKAVKGPTKQVGKLIEQRAQTRNIDEILEVLGTSYVNRACIIVLISLELKQVYNRDIDLLSGGELQRFAIGTVCVQEADVYVSILSSIAILMTLVICSMSHPLSWM